MSVIFVLQISQLIWIKFGILPWPVGLCKHVRFFFFWGGGGGIIIIVNGRGLNFCDFEDKPV